MKSEATLLIRSTYTIHHEVKVMASVLSKDRIQDWQIAEEERSAPQCLQREIHMEYGNQAETMGHSLEIS